MFVIIRVSLESYASMLTVRVTVRHAVAVELVAQTLSVTPVTARLARQAFIVNMTPGTNVCPTLVKTSALVSTVLVSVSESMGLCASIWLDLWYM